MFVYLIICFYIIIISNDLVFFLLLSVVFVLNFIRVIYFCIIFSYSYDKVNDIYNSNGDSVKIIIILMIIVITITILLLLLPLLLLLFKRIYIQYPNTVTLKLWKCTLIQKHSFIKNLPKHLSNRGGYLNSYTSHLPMHFAINFIQWSQRPRNRFHFRANLLKLRTVPTAWKLWSYFLFLMSAN